MNNTDKLAQINADIDSIDRKIATVQRRYRTVANMVGAPDLVRLNQIRYAYVQISKNVDLWTYHGGGRWSVTFC